MRRKILGIVLIMLLSMLSGCSSEQAFQQSEQMHIHGTVGAYYQHTEYK